MKNAGFSTSAHSIRPLMFYFRVVYNSAQTIAIFTFSIRFVPLAAASKGNSKLMMLARNPIK